MSISVSHRHPASLALIGLTCLTALQAPQIHAQSSTARTAAPTDNGNNNSNDHSPGHWELTVSPFAYHWTHIP